MDDSEIEGRLKPYEGKEIKTLVHGVPNTVKEVGPESVTLISHRTWTEREIKYKLIRSERTYKKPNSRIILKLREMLGIG